MLFILTTIRPLIQCHIMKCYSNYGSMGSQVTFAWSWFKAYLTALRQSVRVCNQTSEYLPVISGVPQGSLLGPLLYILYINNMFNLFNITRPFTFADDTKPLMTLYTSEDYNHLQQDLQELATQINSWHLLLNTSKCFHLHYHFSNTEYSTVTYCINGETVVTNNNIKDLEIKFSTDLHWNSH